MCSSDLYAWENLKTLLNEKLNDTIYSTFKETFSNTNLDSARKLSPTVHVCNKEITKFIQEVDIRYGILLDYTVLKFQKFYVGQRHSK